MTREEALRAQMRELAHEEIERNPPPPASPELVARIAAIIAGTPVPDMDNARVHGPGVAADDSPPGEEGRHAKSTHAA